MVRLNEIIENNIVWQDGALFVWEGARGFAGRGKADDQGGAQDHRDDNKGKPGQTQRAFNHYSA